MKMDRSRRKLKLIVASVLIIFALGFCLTLPHWWLAVSTAQIVYNGKPSHNSRLYRSSSGELLLQVSEPNEFAYWITPRNRKVYSPNSTNLSFFSFAAFVEHNDQYGVDLEHTAKTDINPKIVGGSNFIEFTSLEKQRVRVAW
jgi:hypothetical protein